MNSAVCTLFEGHYHFGLGALANSLYAHGFRGTIYAGYRGTLPPWAGKSKMQDSYTDFSPAEGLTLRFIPLATKIHLTNYKPDFMLQVWNEHCPDAEALFYFDPDITVKCRWSFYEEWIPKGLAMVEEIATHGMPYNHPIRLRWLSIAKELGIPCQANFSQYFNGGFLGVHQNCKHFLNIWSSIMAAMPRYGINLSLWMPADRTHPFCGTDQDAMNILAMAAEPHLSTIGPEGMDFIPGGFTMSHAVGSPKPWKKNYLLSGLHGIKPSLADKGFWNKASTPIRLYSDHVVLLHQKTMKLASLIGRFYSQ